MSYSIQERMEWNDTHGTLYGLTSREWRAVRDIALVCCEVCPCIGGHNVPCDEHFEAAEELFRKITNKSTK